MVLYTQLALPQCGRADEVKTTGYMHAFPSQISARVQVTSHKHCTQTSNFALLSPCTSEAKYGSLKS